MPPRDRNSEALWRRLIEEAGDEAIEAAASVSVGEAERDLAAAGFDVAAERAVAQAWIDALEPRRRA